MRVALPLIGIVLVASGLRAYLRTRSTAAAWYLLCWCSTCIALSLWPAENSAWLDQQTHLVGAGRGIGALFAWVGQAAMFLFTLSFTARWRRGDARALRAFALLGCVELLAWLLLAPVASADHLLQVVNVGYHGRPVQLLVFNVVYGVSVAAGFLLGGAGNLHVWRTARDRHSQINGLAGVLTSLDGLIYGVVVASQATADRLGYGATGITRLMPAIVVLGVVPMVGTTWAAIYGRPAWDYLRRWVSLQARARALRGVRRDLLNANILLSDRLVYLYGHEDLEVIERVSARCKARHMRAKHCRIAEEAARWITFSRVHHGVAQRSHQSSAERETEVAADAERRAEGEHYFYADVFRVVALVLGDDRHPDLGSPRHHPGWQHDLAAIIRETLAECHGDQRATVSAFGRRTEQEARGASAVEPSKHGGARPRRGKRWFQPRVRRETGG